MAIPDRFLEDLIAQSDIVDVVSGYVQLTKRTGSNLFGLCPFHNEKTPSFSVNREKQIYHCFGCGKGGGVVSFIMEIENLSFRDAVEFLAKRAGMTMPEDGVDDETRNRRARLLEINKEAARHFHGNLKKPTGASAIAYLKRRGISWELAVRFGLGAAPDRWDDLVNALTAKGFTVGEMLEAGLVKRGNHGPYDLFRNRLMFPVIDVRGNVIGFSGRILGDGEPKYLNSPDTPVFQKSRNLFALNLAKKTKRDSILLVEGNIDVVTLHQAGFDNAVASLGTSLTPEQARLMTRYSNKAIISYDSDGAGVKAAQRAIGILESVGMDVRVLKMDGAKDPDEFIQKKGSDAFQILLDQSENQIEYRLAILKGKHDLSTDEGRVRYLSEATQLLASLSSAVEREVFGRKVAEQTGVSADAVALEVKKTYKKRVSSAKKKLEREETRPLQGIQPKAQELRYDNPLSAKAEEGVIRLLLADPQLIETAGLDDSLFTSPFLQKVYRAILRRYADGSKIEIRYMEQEFTPSETAWLTQILRQPETKQNMDLAMKDYIEKINTERLKHSGPDALRALTEKYRSQKGYGG